MILNPQSACGFLFFKTSGKRKKYAVSAFDIKGLCQQRWSEDFAMFDFHKNIVRFIIFLSQNIAINIIL